MTKKIGIYHKADLDGLTCGGIMLKCVPGIELIGWDYGDPIPDIPKDAEVYMADISFPMTDIHKIIQGCKSFVWADHHVSAITDFFEYYDCKRSKKHHILTGTGKRTKTGLKWKPAKDKPDDLTVVLSEDLSACELLWSYFAESGIVSSKYPSEQLRLIGMYDTFRHKGTKEEEYVKQFQYGARLKVTYPHSAMSCIVDPRPHTFIEKVLRSGEEFLRYLNREAEELVKEAAEITISEKTFGFINKNRFNPSNFNIDYPEHWEGFVCLWITGGNARFSIYSDSVDCSEIAKDLGGGGHKGAAGFNIAVEELSNFLKEHKYTPGK